MGLKNKSETCVVGCQAENSKALWFKSGIQHSWRQRLFFLGGLCWFLLKPLVHWANPPQAMTKQSALLKVHWFKGWASKMRKMLHSNMGADVFPNNRVLQLIILTYSLNYHIYEEQIHPSPDLMPLPLVCFAGHCKYSRNLMPLYFFLKSTRWPYMGMCKLLDTSPFGSWKLNGQISLLVP